MNEDTAAETKDLIDSVPSNDIKDNIDIRSSGTTSPAVFQAETNLAYSDSITATFETKHANNSETTIESPNKLSCKML